MNATDRGLPVPFDVLGAIDGHAHLFNDDGYVERHIAEAERLGIRRSVVSGLGGAWRLLDNDGVLASAERYPERLIPLAFIQLGKDGPDAVKLAASRGFKGLKFSQPLFPYDDERAFPLYERAEQLGMPALFHCGVMAHARGVFTSADYMRPLRLETVARRFPGLRIQVAHLGVPEYEAAATLARIVPNIFVDMTGSTRGWRASKTPGDVASLFFWPTWHRKLIFGTDVRCELLEGTVRKHEQLLSALAPNREARVSVYRDNVLEFLGEIEREPYESVYMILDVEVDDSGGATP